jgi:hypothetical protein
LGGEPTGLALALQAGKSNSQSVKLEVRRVHDQVLCCKIYMQQTAHTSCSATSACVIHLKSYSSKQGLLKRKPQ